MIWLSRWLEKRRQAKKEKANRLKVIQVVKDPVDESVRVNIIQNVKSAQEAVQILYIGYLLMETKFRMMMAGKGKTAVIIPR